MYKILDRSVQPFYRDDETYIQTYIHLYIHTDTLLEITSLNKDIFKYITYISIYTIHGNGPLFLNPNPPTDPNLEFFTFKKLFTDPSL